ncbi:MAG TPA: iron-siderophore ABC transporter substrate-binding protein [Actinomycetota bacterium]|nr:iron-siderophore ABC transporter substrate-binding protein [Actinomycetota bacterium]
MLASFRIARRLVPLLVVLLGASCVNSGSPASSSSSREDPAIPEGRGLVTENPDGSRTVRSAYGTATVPAHPQRVVSVIGDIDFETLLALGMKPVGAGTQGGNLDSGFAPHLAGKLEGVQPLAWSDGAPIEAIAALKPDLIFVPNEESARQLEKVAPVVPRGSWIGTQWKEDFLYLAEVVGRSADAKRLLSEYEARAGSLRDRIAPKVAGKTVLSPQVAYDHAQVYVDSDDALSGAVLTELGMTLHEVALRDDEDGISVSFEQLDQLGADYLFWQVRQADDGSIDSKGVELVKGTPLFSRLPAVASGGYFEVPNRPWYFPTILSAQQILDDVEKALLQ